MKPTQEQLDLIKSCIVQHPSYDPKKCRMADLAGLVWEKSSMFINSIASENTVKKYVMKVVSENLEKCNIASDIAQIQEAQNAFIEETIPQKPNKTSEPIVDSFKETEPQAPENEPEIPQEPELATEVIATPKEPAPSLSQTQDVTASDAELEVLQELKEEEDISLEHFSINDEGYVEPIRTIEYFNLEDLAITPIEPEPEKSVARRFESSQVLPATPQEDAYKDIKDPLDGIKAKKVSKELTEKIIDIVKFAHKKDPDKQYCKIFHLKYVQKLKQSEIARQLGIAEDELCDRYLKLVRIVKNGLQ